MNEELKKIKKIYGEEMMHLCRELFPTILEKEGLLLKILLKKLASTHSIAEDIKKCGCLEKFKNWIYGLADDKKKDLIFIDKTPFELMEEKGYTLYECKNEGDIQKFRKYYKEDELICTITEGNRLERCYVFFAVKKNVDSIKREMFFSPKREDDYGTSVISIQFSRGENNTLSIKNRYNHTVINADSTFSNNLENICIGLTRSFENFYHLNIDNNIRIEDSFLTNNMKYVKASNGKYYRYNLVIPFDGLYYCENNIVIKDDKVISTYANNKERYLLIDEYLIDRQEKKIVSLEKENDSFIKSINDVGKIIKIEVSKNNDEKEICLILENDRKIKIKINKHSEIIGYENNYVEEIEAHFLSNNQALKSIALENALNIHFKFLESNKSLEEITLPKVLNISDNFLCRNTILKHVSLPQCKMIGNCFLFSNRALEKIELPNILLIGNAFMANNRILNEIDLPMVKRIGKEFLFYNECINEIKMDNVISIDDCFMVRNKSLENIDLPKVEVIGNEFLKYNYTLSRIELDNVLIIGDRFLYNNYYLNEVLLPKVQKIGSSFMRFNVRINNISFPCVKSVGDNFLASNPFIQPKLVFDKELYSAMNNRKDDSNDKSNYQRNK